MAFVVGRIWAGTPVVRLTAIEQPRSTCASAPASAASASLTVTASPKRDSPAKLRYARTTARISGTPSTTSDSTSRLPTNPPAPMTAIGPVIPWSNVSFGTPHAVPSLARAFRAAVHSGAPLLLHERIHGRLRQTLRVTRVGGLLGPLGRAGNRHFACTAGE